MDKPRWLLMQTTVKVLVLLLALGLFLGKGLQAFARDDDPGLLNQQVLQLYQEGKYQEAIPFAEKLLAIRKRTLGCEDPSTAQSLNNLAALYLGTGDYSKAEPLFQQALQIRKKLLGQQHPDTATTLNNLAFLYLKMGAYAKAEPLFQQALQIEKKVLGLNNPDTAATLQNLAFLYHEMGDYGKAEPLYQQALQIKKKVLGKQHPDTATTLDSLAALYYDMGAYAKAEPLYQQALQIRKKALGADHPDTAQSLNNLAALYVALVDYGKAEPLLVQALQISQKALGSEHPDTARSLNNLAALYKDMGAYAKAEPLYQKALQISKKVLGPEHPYTAATIDNLAGLYKDMGDYVKAEPLYQQALQIRKKALGPDHPKTATSLNNLAELYRDMAAYGKAEPLYQQALEIDQKALGPERPATASSLGNLGLLYADMGDYAKAEPLYEQALEISQKALGPEHPDTATALDALAALYDEMGAYAKAEPLYERALQIYRKALGPEHRYTAGTINNLALLYEHMGDHAKAEPLYEQSLQIAQKALGPENPDIASMLNNLALLYLRIGAYEKAEPLFQQALQIYQKVLGPEHPDTAMSLENLALLKFDLGQVMETKTLAQQGARAHLMILSNVLSFTSEQQRLAYQNTVNPYSLFPMLDGSDAELASTVLRYKGVVLDSLIEDRLVAETSKTPQDRDLLVRLAADKHQLDRLLLQSPNQPSRETDQRIEVLEREVEQIEGQLAQHVAALGQARRALSVRVDQVQAAIPNDGALIEYLRYAHYLGKDKWEERYGVTVLATTGPPRWLALGSAKDVDAAVSRYQALVRGASDPGALSESLETLYAQLWAPIEGALPPGLKRMIISPDGQLNFVSFATLLDSEERFLGEKYTVQYVASGRDLLREVQPATRTAAIVFANPDFILRSSPIVPQADDVASSVTAGILRGTEKRGIENLTFGPLEGTQKECDRLANAFQGWHWQPEVFTGQKATKAAVLQVHSPYILHLATHGFFEAEDRPDTKSTEQLPVNLERSVAHSKFFQNPMHRSGLALAGAQSTLEAWRHGEAPAVENDGIVTAEDVAALDLKGTWLVTLSACDTGSGEAKAGEGVLGLRRGFLQAGAQHLLMTLWPISDETTVQIMTDFYDVARKTDNPPQALAEVQRDWLVKIRKEHGLTQAVRLAGPFIMSSQGKP
jgi:tetratricopeptide (TPR) repeat protein/CHAT domain-containing protein